MLGVSIELKTHKMEQETQNLEIIIDDFKSLKDKSELVGLLSRAKKELYGEDAMPFSVKSLNYHANPNNSRKRYHTFQIAKKTGGHRTIHAPTKGLKSLLRSLNLIISHIQEPHPTAYGFVPNRSIAGNAAQHVNKNYVYNIDLKDFFHAFDRNRVKMGFMQKPFNLKGDKEPLAFLLASLCTHPLEIDGQVKTVLPQGSPTSPSITNLLCIKLDTRLNGLAKRFGATYSRYADDITFSSSHNIYTNPEFLNELHRIIEDDQQLQINPKKTRLQKTGQTQEVTGLTVNEKVNVRRKYVKELRMWLYLWEKYGLKKASFLFAKDYKKQKGHVKQNLPTFEVVLKGKLDFLKMVKGENDPTFNKLHNRFTRLYSEKAPLKDILDIWENQGIEDAMKVYYKTKNT